MTWIPVTVIMFLLGAVLLVYTFRHAGAKIQRNYFYNEVLCGLLFITSGFLFPYMFACHSPGIAPEVIQRLWSMTSVVLIIETIVWLAFMVYGFFKTGKDPRLRKERDYYAFCVQFRDHYEDTYKKDMKRKALHILPVAVIFIVWGMGFILQKRGLLAEHGLDHYSFSYWLIITIGFGFCVMFLIGDLIRLNCAHTLPRWGIRWFTGSMVPDELDTIVSSAPMVLALIPFVFMPFPFLAAVASVGALADSAASIIGKKYGRHYYPKGSKKTVEGYAAGAGSTFVLVFTILWAFQRWMPAGLPVVLLMSLAASLMFFLVDRFATGITDNALNPLAVGLGMWAVLQVSSPV